MKLSLAIATVVLSAGMLAACTTTPTTTTTEPTPEETRTPPTAISPETRPIKGEVALTLDEVAKHSTDKDCWLAIEGKVYDVTPYITAAIHPGKAAILEGCGKDATELFNTRPMGSGTPHSDKARGFLSKYYLGELVTTPEPTEASSETPGETMTETP